MILMPDNNNSNELDRVFSKAIGDISQPRRRLAHFKFGIGLLVLILVIVSIGLLTRDKSLLHNLPGDTDIYLSVILPRPEKRMNKIFFWRQSEPAQKNFIRLLPGLNLLNWPGKSFGRDILPLLENKIEIAYVSGHGYIIKTRLADKFKWFNLVGAASGEIDNETREIKSRLLPSWLNGSGRPDRFFWLVRGDDLFIFQNQDYIDFLESQSDHNLKKNIKDFGLKMGLINFYAKNSQSITGLDNQYFNLLAASSEFPLLVVVRAGNNNLILRSNAVVNPGLDNDFKGIFGQMGLVKGNLVLKFSDLQNQYYTWRDNLSLASAAVIDNIRQIESITNEFYQVKIADLLGSLSNKQGVLALGEREKFNNERNTPWLFFVDESGREPNLNLLSGIENLSRVFFAITHPLVVERQLVDGTKMLENRLEIKGLELQDMKWPYKETEINLKYLRGNGEIAGYYSGFIPGAGYIFTNSLRFAESNLDSILTGLEEKSISDTGYYQCFGDREGLTSLSLKPNLVTGDAMWNEIVKEFRLVEFLDGTMAGCLEF